MPISVNYSPLLNQYINTAKTAVTPSCAPEIKTESKEENIKKLEEKSERIVAKHVSFSTLGKSTKTILNGNVNNFSPLKFNLAAIRLDAVELYKNGVISYENADKMLTRKDKINDSTINVAASILTGFLSTAAGFALNNKLKASNPIIIGVSTIVGAVSNIGLKFIDRKLNKIDGDETDIKTIGKDALTGAINGLLSGINASNWKDFGKKIKTTDDIINVKYVAKKVGFEALKQAGFLAAAKIFNYRKDKKET